MNIKACQIDKKECKGIFVCKFIGKLLISSTNTLKTELTEDLTNNNYKMVLVLDELTFTDSSGLTLFISLLRTANEHGGDIKLVNPSNAVLSVLKITKLTEVFEIYPNVEEACQAF